MKRTPLTRPLRAALPAANQIFTIAAAVSVVRSFLSSKLPLKSGALSRSCRISNRKGGVRVHGHIDAARYRVQTQAGDAHAKAVRILHLFEAEPEHLGRRDKRFTLIILGVIPLISATSHSGPRQAPTTYIRSGS